MLATVKDFARLLRVPERDGDEALRSERAARHVLSRRALFGVSAAMVAGTAFSFPATEARARRRMVWVMPDGDDRGDGSLWYPVRSFARATELVKTDGEITIVVQPGDNSQLTLDCTKVPPTVAISIQVVGGVGGGGGGRGMAAGQVVKA